MASVVKLANLGKAISDVNTILTAQNRGYTVAVTNEKIEPKEPIFLQVKYTDGKTRNIGITHLVNLEGDDFTPFEKIARSTEQVGKAILVRIDLFFDAVKRGHYITEGGTIFDFKETKILIHEDKTFSIKGIKVTFSGRPLPISCLQSEGTIEFRQMSNGDVQLYDHFDRRTGKGIFINTKGEIYRADTRDDEKKS